MLNVLATIDADIERRGVWRLGAALLAGVIFFGLAGLVGLRTANGDLVLQIQALLAMNIMVNCLVLWFVILARRQDVCGVGLEIEPTPKWRERLAVLVLLVVPIALPACGARLLSPRSAFPMW